MIGNIIKKARKNQKLSQRELAKLTGLTQAGISKLELGGCDPSAKTMIKLTEILGLKFEFNERFDPILQMLTRNLSCETCNAKQ